MTEHYIRSSKKSTNLQKARISSDSTYSSPRTDMDSFTNYTRDLLKTNKSVDIQLVPKQRLQTTILDRLYQPLSSPVAASPGRKSQKSSSQRRNLWEWFMLYFVHLRQQMVNTIANPNQAEELAPINSSMGFKSYLILCFCSLISSSRTWTSARMLIA
jgi:hypothetical protein